MVREEEGSLAAEDVVHPLRTLAQQAYSQDMTSHAANQVGHADQQRSVLPVQRHRVLLPTRRCCCWPL